MTIKKYNRLKYFTWAIAIILSFRIAVTTSRNPMGMLGIFVLCTAVCWIISKIIDRFSPGEPKDEMVIQIYDGYNVKTVTNSKFGDTSNYEDIVVTKEGYHSIRVWERNDPDYKFGVSIGKLNFNSFKTISEAAEWIKEETFLPESYVIGPWIKMVGGRK